jgi:hypothetical protein
LLSKKQNIRFEGHGASGKGTSNFLLSYELYSGDRYGSGVRLVASAHRRTTPPLEFSSQYVFAREEDVKSAKVRFYDVLLIIHEDEQSIQPTDMET